MTVEPTAAALINDVDVVVKVRPPELAEGRDGHYPVIVVGAGPVGLTAAIDLAHQGQPVLLIDDLVDSRWTLTVAARALRRAGSGPVLPFVLASRG